MAHRQGERGGAPKRPKSERTFVEDAGGRRPFMRGIMIHSLMGRGVSFEDAYSTASLVRERIYGRGVVTRDELGKAVREVLGDAKLGDEVRPAARPLQISVDGEGQDRPFSKGILSQSLLAAALEPNDAFDVARLIEEQLLQKGVRRIDRRQLRRIAYQTLHEHSGQRVADRYLSWRKYQQSERPVIILLGGAAGSGKTVLALEVAHRLGIGRVISADAIRQVMRIMLSPQLMPAIHASSYDAHTQLPDTA